MSRKPNKVTRSTLHNARVDLVMLNSIIQHFDPSVSKLIVNASSYFMELNGNDELNPRVNDIMLNTLKYYSILVIDDDTDVACDTVEEMFDEHITPVLNLNTRQVKAKTINLDNIFGINNDEPDEPDEDEDEDLIDELTDDFGYNIDEVPF